MSGIYIHVPYCKVKCEYCDFYSVVSNEDFAAFADLIEKEMGIRAGYLPKNRISTIYFGGGTPSLLTIKQIEQILSGIVKRYKVDSNAEITLETNPDDLTPNKLHQLQNIGINRLSIGVQSFSDADLKQLGRRHNANQAISAIEWANDAGFNNISIDLIYGLPYSSTPQWQQNLKTVFQLPVRHLSCYHLIYEDGTPLKGKVNKGTVMPVNEDISVEQFHTLQKMAAENGFIHYEISNLAKEGCYARHNTAYWQQIPYLGLGPSAHSYSGSTRDWNPRSISAWTEAIKKGYVKQESETLTVAEKVNDYLLTSLRTIWGADTDYIKQTFGNAYSQQVLDTAKRFLDLEIMRMEVNKIMINPSHSLISDGIIAEFMV